MSHAHQTDSASARLASLTVGESLLFPEWNCAYRLGSIEKIYARKRLDNPDANWSAKTTTKGVRVTRVR